jgi:hypothetical protein
MRIRILKYLKEKISVRFDIVSSIVGEIILFERIKDMIV